MEKLLLFFSLFLLFSTPSLALKVSSTVNVPYDPGQTFNSQICIVPEGITQVKLTSTGSFKDNIGMDSTTLDLSGGTQCIPYTITVPEEFDRPGVHQSAIMVEEVPSEQARGQIRALISIPHQIRIEVPYPGKWLDLKLSAQNREEGEFVPINLKLTSKGNQTINTIQGDIDIYNWDGEHVASFSTDTITDLESQKTAEITEYWNSSGNQVGDYQVKAEVSYDGKQANATNDFKLGSLEVRLVKITEQVYKDGIVPFHVTAESYWSETVPSVSAQVEVFNDSLSLTSFDTLTKDIPAWETQSLKGFLDTTELGYENYTANITLNYADSSNKYSRTFEVAKKPEPEVEEPSLLDSINTTQILLTTTILLALIALILAFKAFKSEDKEEEEEENHSSDVETFK